MSQTTWNILGILTILTVLTVLLWMPEQYATIPADQRAKYQLGIFLFSGLLAIIACTCFFPQFRPFGLRVLGIYGTAGCIFILIEGFRQHDFSQYPIALCFWLPGSMYLAMKGKLDNDNN